MDDTICSPPLIRSTLDGTAILTLNRPRQYNALSGALLAALLIGFVDTFGKVLLPQAAGVLVYVMMALILLWKPDGLFKAG